MKITGIMQMQNSYKLTADTNKFWLLCKSSNYKTNRNCLRQLLKTMCDGYFWYYADAEQP